jgi:hypothetical protein
MTRMLFVVAIALALASGISAHAADVSAEAKAAVEKAITEMGCSMDVDDEVEANGDGYAADDVQCKDGPYYMIFDKATSLPARRSKTEPDTVRCTQLSRHLFNYCPGVRGTPNDWRWAHGTFYGVPPAPPPPAFNSIVAKLGAAASGLGRISAGSCVCSCQPWSAHALHFFKVRAV